MASPRNGHTVSGFDVGGYANVHIGDRYYGAPGKPSPTQSITNSESGFLTTFNPLYMETHRQNLPEHVDGTCSWLLDNEVFQIWHASATSSVLWFIGEAGTGKTVLTDFLLNTLCIGGISSEDEADESVDFIMPCFFFCDQNQSAQSEATAIMRGLFSQIIQRSHDILRKVKKTMRYHEGKTFDDAWTMFSFAAKSLRSGCLYILIDAIDECEVKSRPKLIDRISSMVRDQRYPTPVKVFITSRPSAVWHNIGQGASAYLPRSEECRKYVDADIEKIVDVLVADLINQDICSERDAKEVKAILLSRADGCLLWVCLALDQIQYGPPILSSQLRSTLDSLPEDLKSAYRRMLPLPPANRLHQTFLKRILGFLIVSARPMNMEEMNLLLSVKENSSAQSLRTGDFSNMKGALQQLLGPLIQIKDEKVSFMHASVRDWFVAITPDDPLHSTHGVDVQAANMDLAASCVRYLLLDDFAHDMLGLDGSSAFHPISPNLPSTGSDPSTPSTARSHRSDAENSPDLVLGLLGIGEMTIASDRETMDRQVWSRVAQQFPAYDFAARFWTRHLQACEKQTWEDSVRNNISRLLSFKSPHCCNWVEYARSEASASLPHAESSSDLALAAVVGAVDQILGTSDVSLSEVTDGEFHEALYWSIRHNQPDAIRFILSKITIVDVEIRGTTPLITAVEAGSPTVVELLLGASKANINLPNHKGQTPLFVAASEGHLEILKLLLRMPEIEPNAADNRGRTALIEAAAVGSRDCVEMLIRDHRVTADAADITGWTAFIYAADQGLDDVVEALLDSRQASVNAEDARGRQALAYAAMKGHLRVVRRLIKRGASIGHQDLEGRNVISLATNSRQATTAYPGGKCVLEYLVSLSPNGASVGDSNGWDALFWTVDPPGYIGAMRLLFAKGRVDINRRDGISGRTPLSWCASQGMLELMEVLMEQPGCNIDLPNDDGQTALISAAAAGRAESCARLIQMGADTKVRDLKGRNYEDWLALSTGERR